MVDSHQVHEIDIGNVVFSATLMPKSSVVHDDAGVPPLLYDCGHTGGRVPPRAVDVTLWRASVLQ